MELVVVVELVVRSVVSTNVMVVEMVVDRLARLQLVEAVLGKRYRFYLKGAFIEQNKEIIKEKYKFKFLSKE